MFEVQIPVSLKKIHDVDFARSAVKRIREIDE